MFQDLVCLEMAGIAAIVVGTGECLGMYVLELLENTIPYRLLDPPPILDPTYLRCQIPATWANKCSLLVYRRRAQHRISITRWTVLRI